MKSQAPTKQTKQDSSIPGHRTRHAKHEASIVDNRPEAVAQCNLIEMMNGNTQVMQQKTFADGLNNSPRMVAQRTEYDAMSGGAVQLPAATSNNTGLPDNLKSGIESLSSMSMDHVKVHYNSSQPAQLHALAHAQGSEIHVAPGQERHLPHEAWHVVQQAQGRVQPTMQMKNGVVVNDDAGLEHEADVMGAKAASHSAQLQAAPEIREIVHGPSAPVQRTHLRSEQETRELMESRRLLLEALDQAIAAEQNTPELNEGSTQEEIQSDGNTPELNEGSTQEEIQSNGNTPELNEGSTQEEIQSNGNTPEAVARAQEHYKVLQDFLNDAHTKYGVDPAKANNIIRRFLLQNSRQTATAFGAFVANQVNLKTKIGPVKNYMSTEQLEAHRKQFEGGGHAFITGTINKNIRNLNPDGKGWGRWGVDANFVAPLHDMEKLIEAALKPNATGIYALEKALGVPEGNWVAQCEPDYTIYRYIVRKPAELSLRVPRGNESGAYGPYVEANGVYHRGVWRPLGITEGGASEAVIKAMTLAQLDYYLATEVIQIVEEKRLETNTRRVAEEKKGEVT